ncbi:MAG: N-acetyltransferase [Pseudomonadota bacterium]
MTVIRPLQPDDAAAYRALRLFSIEESPTSVWASHDEESALSQSAFAQRLTPTPHQIVMGAFHGDKLLGIAGMRRENVRKIAHRAGLWGIYVMPEARGAGLARQMVNALIAHARAQADLVQLTLCVRSSNESAKQLYTSMGFIRTGVDPRSMLIDGDFHDEDRMVLRLDQQDSTHVALVNAQAFPPTYQEPPCPSMKD